PAPRPSNARSWFPSQHPARKVLHLVIEPAVLKWVSTVSSGGASSMCDYSLHLVRSRPAQIEDKLVTTEFNNSITRGFAAVGEPKVAVCLRPGTEVVFDKDVECLSFLGLLPNRKLGEKVAVFR